MEMRLIEVTFLISDGAHRALELSRNIMKYPLASKPRFPVTVKIAVLYHKGFVLASLRTDQFTGYYTLSLP